jgi:hypothetical protein
MGLCSSLAICVNQTLFTKTFGLEQISMNPFLLPFHFGFIPYSVEWCLRLLFGASIDS